MTLTAISPFSLLCGATGDELLLDYGEAYWKDIDDAEKNAQHEDEVSSFTFVLFLFFLILLKFELLEECEW